MGPWGNASPFDSSADEWVIGNIKEESFDGIMQSKKAKEAAERVEKCTRNCAFIVTERHDMVRSSWKPIFWILNNKIRIMQGRELAW